MLGFRRALFGALSVYLSFIGVTAAGQGEAEFGDGSAIASSQGMASRKGSELTLAGNHNPIVLVDGHCLKTTEDHQCKYRFVQYEPNRKFYLVHAYYDLEFDSFLWIRKSDGNISFIPDLPHFSPNEMHFVIARSCEAQGDFCGVQIWNSDGPKEVWEHRPANYALYAFAQWTGDKKVDLHVTTWIEHQLKENPATISESSGDHWELSGPIEKAE